MVLNCSASVSPKTSLRISTVSTILLTVTPSILVCVANYLILNFLLLDYLECGGDAMEALVELERDIIPDSGISRISWLVNKDIVETYKAICFNSLN